MIGGRIAAIAERVPAHVDRRRHAHHHASWSRSTNADPRRGVGHEKVLTRIKVDEAADRAGRRAGLRHGRRAARRDAIVKLDADRQHVAPAASRSTGPWRRTRRTSRSPRRPPGWSGWTSPASTSSPPTSPSRSGRPAAAICEVNAAPGFRMHTHPTEGDPQYVAKPVIDLLFPPGTPSADPDRRGHRHQRQDDDRPDDRPHLQGHRPQGRHDLDRRRRASTSGWSSGADASGPRSAKMVLQNPRVDFAVFEVARGGILREGLGYERNDVGGGAERAAGDHLGLRGIDTARAAGRRQGGDRRGRPAQRVSRCSTPTTRWSGHAHAAARAGRLVHACEPGSESDSVDDHCRRGGRAVVLERSDARRHDRGQGGPALDAAGLDPPAAVDLRRPGAR